MVNVIAPIYTSPEGMFLQTIYHPLRLAAEKSGSIALDTHVECETYPADYLGVPAVPYVDVLASLEESARKLFVSLVNLRKDRAERVDLRLVDSDVAAEGQAHVISGEAPDVVNDFGEERVAPKTERLTEAGAAFSYTLPPLSHAVLELDVR
jgi:alpha-N-arabinofuranosidase